MKRIFAITTLVILFGSSAIAGDCKHFNKSEFTGIFTVVDYICEENTNRGSNCYTTSDVNTKVTSVDIMLVPTGIDQGVQVELIDDSNPMRPKVILTHTFTQFGIGQSELSCFEYEEDGKKVFKISQKSEMGDLKSSIQLLKKGKIVEFEINSSLRNVNSSYRFIIGKP